MPSKHRRVVPLPVALTLRAFDRRPVRKGLKSGLGPVGRIDTKTNIVKTRYCGSRQTSKSGAEGAFLWRRLDRCSVSIRSVMGLDATDDQQRDDHGQCRYRGGDRE